MKTWTIRDYAVIAGVVLAAAVAIAKAYAWWHARRIKVEVLLRISETDAKRIEIEVQNQSEHAVTVEGVFLSDHETEETVDRRIWEKWGHPGPGESCWGPIGLSQTRFRLPATLRASAKIKTNKRIWLSDWEDLE